MNSFYEKETALLERWCNSSAYSEEDRASFCYDGLIYRRDPNCKDEEFAEVRKWKQAKRKGMLDDILKQEKLKFNFKTALDNNRNNTPFLLLISKDNEEGIILNNENNYIINKHKDNNKYKLAPDFNRYLSREHLNNLSKRKGRIINGDLSPNYNSIVRAFLLFNG